MGRKGKGEGTFGVSNEAEVMCYRRGEMKAWSEGEGNDRRCLIGVKGKCSCGGEG